jgi:hypothetical protein
MVVAYIAPILVAICVLSQVPFMIEGHWLNSLAFAFCAIMFVITLRNSRSIFRNNKRIKELNARIGEFK